MSKNHAVSAVCYMHGSNLPSTPRTETLMAAHILTACETLRGRAAQKGRAIVTPTVQYEEVRPFLQDAVGVIVRAQTALRHPGRRKEKRT